MSTALFDTTTLTEELAHMAPTNRTDAANHLQSDWGGCQLAFVGWPGTTSAVKPDKKAIMADAVGAKKIGASVPKFDTKAPTYKALVAVKGRIKETWERFTLDWVEDGIRLIRRDRVADFQSAMEPLAAELDAARNAFADAYPALIDKARDDNGDLYDPAAYLPTFDGQYAYSVDYPSLTPPSWIRDFSPDLYAEQSAKIAARFDQAVSLAEDAFIGELAKMLDDLQRKLNGLDDGTAKVLHGSTIDNLRTFFERFKAMNLHSSAELDRVVAQAEEALSGNTLIGGPVTREDLRDNATLRRTIGTRLSAVTATLDGMMTLQPRRALNRRIPAHDATAETPTE